MEMFQLTNFVILQIFLINFTVAELYPPVVIVHGGAGSVSTESIPYKLKGVKLAVRIGHKTLLETGSVLDAVEEAVRSMELDEYFNAGYGSVLTWNGTVEADAAIMHGFNLSAGCVSICEDILHPITLGRRVMEKTNHNYLAGNGLREFAIGQGFEILPKDALVTKRSQQALDDYKKSLNKTEKHDKYEFGEPGTVGAVAIDTQGNIAVATSTGGITGKLQGRIGDSSILGAGTYADNLFGGISATGHGEAIMRFNVAQKILQLLEFVPISIQTAADKVLHDMKVKLNSTAGIIGIDSKRNIGISFTSDQMAWAYIILNKIHYGINHGDHFIDNL